MPSPRSKLTLATTMRDGFADLPGGLVLQYLGDALKKCIDNPELTWSASVATVAGAALLNPLAAAGLLGLGVAFKLDKIRKDKAQARQVEAELRAQAAAQGSMHDILLKIENRSITVGLDELALQDIKTIVTDALQNNSPRLSDKLEAAFNAEIDQLPPGPLRDELDNLRILAQDTNTTVHHNNAGIAANTEGISQANTGLAEANKGIANLQEDLAELKNHILAGSPAAQGSADSTDSNAVLDDALLRLAQDAERGVESARKAVEDKSPAEAGEYFIEKLASLDRSRAAIEQRMDEDEVQISRQAAEVLFRTGQIDEAEQALQRILHLRSDDLDAINRLGHIYKLRGDLPAAEAQYRRLLTLAPEEPSDLAIAYGNLGVIHKTRGDLDQAEEMHRQSVEIAERLGWQEGMAMQYGNLGLIYEIRGDLDQAEEILRQALAINERLGRQEGMASDYGNLGLIYKTRGELDRAEEMHRQALEINERLGRQEGMAKQYGNLGLIYKTRGDLDQAEEMHRQAVEIAERLGWQEGMAMQYGNLGLIYQTRGDLDQAEEMHRQALAINERLGRQEGMAKQYGNLGLIYQTRGDLDQAEEMHRQALEINERLGRQEGMANQYGNLGLIYQTRGDLDQAEEMLLQSLTINERLGRQEGMASDYVNLGSIAKQRGDVAQVEKCFTVALGIYRKLGNLERIASMLGNLGVLYLDNNRYRDAVSKIQDATRISQVIGNESVASYGIDLLSQVTDSNNVDIDRYVREQAAQAIEDLAKKGIRNG